MEKVSASVGNQRIAFAGAGATGCRRSGSVPQKEFERALFAEYHPPTVSIEAFISDLKTEREALERVVVGLREVIGSTSSPPSPVKLSCRSRDEYLEMLDEYKFLRVELENIWGQTYTTMNFVFTAIGLVGGVAFSQFGDPIVLLPCASLLTLGGYKLIRINTTRVWRIVGYMRCALEKNLSGIRWETRLAERRRASKSTSNPELDRDIFDGHVFILNVVNAVIALLMIATVTISLKANDLVFGNSHVLRAIPYQCAKAILIFVAFSFPASILAWSLWTQSSFKRGGTVESDHLDSWTNRNKTGDRVCEAEPPTSLDHINDYHKRTT